MMLLCRDEKSPLSRLYDKRENSSWLVGKWRASPKVPKYICQHPYDSLINILSQSCGFTEYFVAWEQGDFLDSLSLFLAKKWCIFSFVFHRWSEPGWLFPLRFQFSQ